MSGYVLAIDQGTTSSRAIVFDGRQDIAGMGKMEFTQHFPQDGWVEHVPEEIWATSLWSAKTALKKANLKAAEIAAIGITNQRETTIVWDRATGKPIHNAIVWQDRRTHKLCDKLKKAGARADDQRKKTGLLLDPYFSATKIAWILDNVPGARKRAEKGELAFGTVDSYLIWRLTGGKSHATDATNACRTLLYNIETSDWDDELLELFRMPRAMLPVVKDNADDFGVTDPEVLGRSDPHLRRGRRPAGGDDRAGLLHAGHAEIDLWHGLLRAAQHRQRYGALEEPAADHHRLSHRRQDHLCARGRDLHGRRLGAVAARQAAAVRGRVRRPGRSPPRPTRSQNVYLVPAFVGLGAPWWDAARRAARSTASTRNTGARPNWRGRRSNRSAYQTRDLIDAMRKDWKGARYGAARRWRHGRLGLDHAVPRRHSRCPRRPSDDPRNHRTRRCVASPAGRPGSGPISGALPSVGRSIASSTRRWIRACASASSRAGATPWGGP